jgi:Arc/MetJ-type ribon-helix-helix transcriptional regulator
MQSMKQSISVTVEKNLVEWVDAQVKTQKFRNRSHLVEVALMRMKDEKKE